jgi:phosphopantetheine--protein transferase-like protein
VAAAAAFIKPSICHTCAPTVELTLPTNRPAGVDSMRWTIELRRVPEGRDGLEELAPVRRAEIQLALVRGQGAELCAEGAAQAQRDAAQRPLHARIRRAGLADDKLPGVVGVDAQQLRGRPDLRFNVSHSDGLALYAIARGREVGVDVEQLRELPRAERIAERFFSTEETAALKAEPAERRVEAFFTCWTRKEAYIKARGDGLAHPLDQFAVSLVPGEPARLWVAGDGDAREIARWSLDALPLAPGYVAALAARGRGWRLTTRSWPLRG